MFHAVAGTILALVLVVLFAAIGFISYETYKLIKADMQMHSHSEVEINKQKSTE